ncbi:MAG: succinylglutamate desuccinylase/aspartoacylase family protein [Chloroflexi bacterium]|nr:succinylglutamate desuccinylase/aspartoacylase family protein [Chloroflexota bacterium]
MRVAGIEAQPGQRAFGYLETVRSRSGLRPDIPVHLAAGVEPGPTLLVQAAIHGTEIIGTAVILRFLQHLDPRRLRGNVIAVPVLNRVGFELGERVSRLDGLDLHRLFPGNPRGSASEQVAHAYFHEVVTKAQVLLDFHCGVRGYERYVVLRASRAQRAQRAQADPPARTPLEEKRRRLGMAFGLDTAAFFPPETFGTNAAEEAVEAAGVVQVMTEFGGGPGWFHNGEQNLRDAERGIWNVLKAMDMVEGELESDGPLCTVYNACVVLWKPPVDGMFIRRRGFGERLRAGEVYGTIQDPYTGETLWEVCTPQEATVLPSGLEWPTVGATTVGILGHVHEVVDRRTSDLRVAFP